MLTVQLISFDEGGLPVPHSVSEGTTVGTFVQNVTGQPFNAVTVKVNRVLAPPEQRLNNGDTVAVNPRKVEGGGN